MDNQQGTAVQHRELCSMLYGSLDGRSVWGRMGTCICMVESLHCSPETVTTLFVNWLYLNTKLKVKKKKKNNTGVFSQCLSHTGFAPLHGVCAFPVNTA